MSIECDSGLVLGYVGEGSRRCYDPQYDKNHKTLERNNLHPFDSVEKSKIKLQRVEVACKTCPFKVGGVYKFSKIGNLRNLIRQTDALRRLESSDFLPSLMNSPSCPPKFIRVSTHPEWDIVYVLLANIVILYTIELKCLIFTFLLIVFYF